ncbi:ABC-2 type transport system permease protein [Kribbella amoyensis]|uniref:ABC-2 type transport system permease protein n=1 Tax=Kribbella amoyensis TaxID=996641 RepID=A0A561BUS2_9ACTN|nr:ABC transporter permease [Kribbella amoyensis]TWD82543.1 ABC-2 type transport system permease protein [Kribbella amoyensis]
MFDIALSELAQTFRNRSVLITSFFMPVAASVFFIWRHEVFETVGRGFIAALVVFTIAAFGLYAGAVTSLAARRQNLFLKRLRSTAVSDAGILVGMVLPATVIAVIQTTLILVVLAAVTNRPSDLVLMVLASVLVLAMMIGLGLATAGVTRSPEHAQVTTLPISLGVIAIVNWVAITGTDSLTMLKRLAPGGAATELLTRAWDGGVPGADVLVLVAPTLAWVAVSGALALKYFQWEPRR